MILPRIVSIVLFLFSLHKQTACDRERSCYPGSNVSIRSSEGYGELCNVTAIIGDFFMVNKLANISSNVVINITSDIPLRTNITLKNLENITIVGYRIPTVNCKDMGGIKFVACNNVTIVGIIWERCGSGNISNYPAIGFYHSSNVFLQSCSFHKSTGQAVVLINMLGNVTINSCEFTYSHIYGDHGSAVLYLTGAQMNARVVFAINGCNFSYNKAVKSVVYIGGQANQLHHLLCLKNSVFTDNKGVPIYILNHRLNIEGDTVFKQNMAAEGAGIFSRNSVVAFGHNSNITFYNNSAVYKGGAIFLNNSNILFQMSSVITFTNNVAIFGGALFLTNKSAISFGGTTTVKFLNNRAIGTVGQGGALYLETCVMLFDELSTVTFSSNSAAYHGGAVYSKDHTIISYNGNSTVTYRGNKASEGGATFFKERCRTILNGDSKVKFTENIARYGGAVSSQDYSNISFNGSTTVICQGNNANRGGGGAFFATKHCSTIFDGNSKVRFSGNLARVGGALFSQFYCNVLFEGNTTVIFENNNESTHGGAVCSFASCNIKFDGNSMVTFNDNKAVFGGAVFSNRDSNILFDRKTTVAFNANYASEDGGAVYQTTRTSIIFDGNSCVTFYNGKAYNGGAIFSHTHGKILFNTNTEVKYKENVADDSGGAIVSYVNGNITYYGNSKVTFINNTAKDGGAVAFLSFSFVLFNGNTTVIYKDNKVWGNGGAMLSDVSSDLTFNGKSKVTYSNNSAEFGGAVYSFSFSEISFHKQTTVMYSSNRAHINGGAIAVREHCIITFDGNSEVIFSGNVAEYGGAVHLQVYSKISLDESTTVTYKYNEAGTSGGAAYLLNCSITIDGHSTVNITNNKAINGGALHAESHSLLSLYGNSTVIFKENNANEHGGAVNSYFTHSITFDGNTEVIFSCNKAKHGGAIYTNSYTTVLFDENATVTFLYNEANLSGGAMSCNGISHASFQRNTKVNFTNNKAQDGGAINARQTNIRFSDNLLIIFNNNSASRSGGAINLVNNFTVLFENISDVVFHNNYASLFGGAIYGELKQTNQSKISSKSTGIQFNNNTALVGNDVYIHMQASCDKTCLNTSIVGLNITHNNPPRRLALYDPATCIHSNYTISKCNVYFINNIMLGENIKINACVLSFYDQHAGGTNFVVNGESEHHKLDGARFVSVICSLFEGTSITGKKISGKTNFSMTITSHTNSDTEISVKLLAELSSCHPGFHYDNTIEKCVCYDNSGIVTCSSSTSTIKRGYWFGVVDGITTVAVCPNNYCNFTCCETTNGFYQLSPVRINQCNLLRSGIACGSCEEGYTLSFDSVECVSVDKCTAGWTVLVIILSVIYWIALVVVVFAGTYYHIAIGYFYAITYYYSMLDSLLGQNLFISHGLFTVVSVMSSVSKVTPQFLGQLCLIKNMSGIDQQVIHYVHPLAVTIIVGVICLSARMSYKFSAFVSRGIIHVICFLVLLSYTSVAMTSLLLLRSLTFYGVDKVYTYLSPDIEYFHGRHLLYGIIAILCTLVIVIGLPLLLLLEPYLNHKMNFTRFKPLLDQFQGCYKDKYRSFASYYMICRLVVISIIIINPSNDNISQALLLITSTLLTFIQLIVKPYKSKTLNMFDGMVLHIMIFASVISLFDGFGTRVLSVFVIILVMLPLIEFIAMELIIYKENIMRVLTHCKHKSIATSNNNEVIMRDIGISSMNTNATIAHV